MNYLTSSSVTMFTFRKYPFSHSSGDHGVSVFPFWCSSVALSLPSHLRRAMQRGPYFSHVQPRGKDQVPEHSVVFALLWPISSAMTAAWWSYHLTILAPLEKRSLNWTLAPVRYLTENLLVITFPNSVKWVGEITLMCGRRCRPDP